MKHNRHRELSCPVCGKLLNTLSDEEGIKPADGDFTICFGCTNVLVVHITNDQVVGLTKKDDFSDVDPVEMFQIREAQAMVRRVRRIIWRT